MCPQPSQDIRHAPTKGSKISIIQGGIKVFMAYLYSAWTGSMMSLERWTCCQLCSAGGKLLWGFTLSEGTPSWGLNLIWSIQPQWAPDVQAHLLVLITVKRIEMRVVKVYACERDLGSQHICKGAQRNFAADLKALNPAPLKCRPLFLLMVMAYRVPNLYFHERCGLISWRNKFHVKRGEKIGV